MKTAFCSPKLFLLLLSLSLLIIIVACGGLDPNTPIPLNNNPPPPSNNPSAPPPSATLQSSVKHIVYMLQENRSFDMYLGKINDYRAAHGLPTDVDGLPANVLQESFDGRRQIAAFKMNSACAENLSASWNETIVAQNLHAPNTSAQPMDGFVWIAAHFARDENVRLGTNFYKDIEGLRAVGYYDADALPYYYFMASNFAMSDRWFAPLPTRTQPNRIFMTAATTQGRVYEPTGPLSAKTIFQLLEEHNVSWKIYFTDFKNNTTITYFPSFYNAHSDKVVPLSEYFTDVQNNTLPQVAFIETGQESGKDEHPVNNIQVGAQFAANIINSLMNSPSWKDSVFILTWDEGGGTYDHVPPPAAVTPDDTPIVDFIPGDFPGSFNRTGMRVPTLVISPFAKKNYVSHTVMDSTAILKFIEERFGLPNLTRRDQAQPSMQEFFDWNNPPWMTPPTPPAQQTNMPCYYDHLP